MRVAVLYFGVLKDLAGVAERTLDLDAGATVGSLLEGLRTDGSRVWGTLAVAVNREYAGLQTELADGDEVALLPPVSGGLGESPHRDETALHGARMGGGR